jgi:thioredoxin reductase (NADPH)
MDEALYLADVASSVTVLVRGDEPVAAPMLAERALGHPKIQMRLNTSLQAIEGNGTVERARVRTADGAEMPLTCAGIFIYVGLRPNTELVRDVLPVDPMGHIPVDAWMRTSVPGVFAAGDIRQHSARQLVTVAGDGATAAIAAARYLRSGEWI